MKLTAVAASAAKEVPVRQLIAAERLREVMAPAAQPRGLLLGYSTNVHPGERLSEIYRYLREYTLPVRDRVFGPRRAGLELRLGIAATRDLMARGARRDFKAFLSAADLQLFSINAYPLKPFHTRRVKEEVYRPPWNQAARARWTQAIAEIFAEILDPGVQGSISTLGGGYRAWGHGPAMLRKIAGGYVEVLETLAALEERSGKHIVLAVEPEPDTSFETAADMVAFFKDFLLPAARIRWKRRWSGPRIEGLLRRYFTVNVDTCHFSVVFREPQEEMDALARAGIAIGKVHVTSALSLPQPSRSPAGYRELRALDEPRYFHQVRAADDEGREVARWADLGRLPRDVKSLAAGGRHIAEIRSHFHVPIHAARWRRLSTTHGETARAVRHVVRKGLCRQLVIETYTWPLLAREDTLVDGISSEYRWLLKVIASARG